MLLHKWGQMTQALENRNIEEALSFFIESSKEKYRYLFKHLSNILPELVSSIDSIELVYLEDGVAEYRLMTIEAEEQVSYYIYFVLDNNGTWKIQQF